MGLKFLLSAKVGIHAKWINSLNTCENESEICIENILNFKVRPHQKSCACCLINCEVMSDHYGYYECSAQLLIAAIWLALVATGPLGWIAFNINRNIQYIANCSRRRTSYEVLLFLCRTFIYILHVLSFLANVKKWSRS